MTDLQDYLFWINTIKLQKFGGNTKAGEIVALKDNMDSAYKSLSYVICVKEDYFKAVRKFIRTTIFQNYANGELFLQKHYSTNESFESYSMPTFQMSLLNFWKP